MLSRLFDVRLKAAEAALRQGRLDEAFRLASAPDLREDRRAANVLTRLTEPLIDRARAHFAADRLAEALLDLDKADAGGTHQARIAELRGQIQTVADEQGRQERSRRGRLEAARDRIEKGSLDAGRRILDRASADDLAARDLQRNAEDREQEAEQQFAEVESLLAAGQLARAVERYGRASRLHPHAPAASALEAKICDHVLTRAKEALNNGRPVQASEEVRILGELGRGRAARREVEQVLGWVRSAVDALHEWRIDDARQAVMRLKNLLPKVSWVQQAAEDLRVVDDKLLALRAGPLGEPLAEVVGPAREAAGAAREQLARPGRAEARALGDTVLLDGAAAGGPLPERLLLLVDGGGSYLLHRGERITIGRVASRHPADIPIFADLAEQHAELAAVGEDCFLFSPREVEVNGALTKQALLQDGDRVTLGRRARFTFRRPSRKSASAILDMSDTTKLPNDVRRVILFRGTATIGYGPTAHARCSSAREGLVLFERARQLWVRPEGLRAAPGGAVPVQLDEPLDVRGVGFVVKSWATPHPGRRQV